MKLNTLKKKFIISLFFGSTILTIPVVAAACATKESIEQKETRMESSLDHFFELSFKFRNYNSMDEKMMKENFEKERNEIFQHQKQAFLQHLQIFKNSLEKDDYANYLDLMNGVLEVVVDINKDIDYIKYLDEVLKELSNKINDSSSEIKSNLTKKEKEFESKILEFKLEVLKTIDKIPNNVWSLILSPNGIEISRVKNIINSIDLSFFVKKGFNIVSNIKTTNTEYYNRTLDNIIKLMNTITSFSKSKTMDKISSSLINIYNMYNNN